MVAGCLCPPCSEGWNIHQRADCTEFGHWEVDLVIGAKSGNDDALLTMIERNPRLYSHRMTAFWKCCTWQWSTSLKNGPATVRIGGRSIYSWKSILKNGWKAIFTDISGPEESVFRFLRPLKYPAGKPLNSNTSIYSSSVSFLSLHRLWNSLFFLVENVFFYISNSLLYT